jgi:hypothetical protein
MWRCIERDSTNQLIYVIVGDNIVHRHSGQSRMGCRRLHFEQILF